MANSRRPTYGLGFARNASESAHSELWRGLISAWIPALGRTGGTLFDISGRNHHGTLINMDPATAWVIGENGYALKFDAANDYVQIPDHPTLNFGAGDFTIITRLTVVAPSSDGNMVITKFDNLVSSARWGIELRNTGKLRGVIRDAGGNQLQVDGTADVDDGGWHQVAWVRSGSNGLLYVDGQLDKSGINANVGSTDVAAPIRIATLRLNGIFDFFLNGTIGHALIYNRALAPKEIQKIYANPLAPFQLRRRNVIILPAFTPILSQLNLITVGRDNIPSGIDLFSTGHQLSSDNITLVTSGVLGVTTVNSSEDLVTIGHTPIESGIDLFTIGHAVETSGLDLFTKGRDTTSGNLNLFIVGHLPSSSNLDLVMPDTKDVINSNTTLFIGSFATNSSDLDLFIPGKDNLSGNLDLVTLGHISVSGDMDLFITSINISSGNLDLFINSKDSINNNLEMFVQGVASESGQLDLFVNGHTIKSGDIDLLIIGEDIISSDLDLFTDGHIFVSSGLDLFIATKDIHSSDLDLFLKVEEVGSGTISDVINLVTFGKQISSNSLDLFIEGKISINANLDLFIGSKDSINDNLALVILSHISTLNNIDLFIKGKTLISEELELIISGHIVSSGNLDLLVKGKDSISSDITLFISGVPGILTIESGIDLFTIGHIQISDDTNLFIFGHLSSSGDLDLVIPDTKDVIGSNIVLFINSFFIDVNSLDLFMIGQDNSSGNLDLFIPGKNVIFSDIDLFIGGHQLSSNNINLFITSRDITSGNLDLFIGTPGIPIESGQIVLCINGVIPRPILLCPSLDSTASIQISDELIGIYQSRIDALINQLGKNILLEFAKIKAPCPNCFFDTLRNRSNGIFRTGGPRPFTRGRRCPWCKGKGFEEIDNNKCIKALLKWTPKDAKKYGIDLRIHKGVVRIKTFLTELDDLVRAETMVANHDITDIIRLRVKLIRNPIPVGLREDRYCISFWAL